MYLGLTLPTVTTYSFGRMQVVAGAVGGSPEIYVQL